MANELLKLAATWLHAAYDRPPQTPECIAMLAQVDAALAQGAEPARDWDAESGCEWFATPPAATQVPSDEQIDDALEAWFANGPVGIEHKTDRTRMRAAIAALSHPSQEPAPASEPGMTVKGGGHGL